MIFNLGSYVGYTSAHFAFLNPDAHIISVEMDRNNYEMALENTRNCPGVHTINAAIWYKDGYVAYEGEEERGFHVINGHQTQNTVKSITIDTLVKEFAVEHIDYLKMDIEGAEFEIFDHSHDRVHNVDTMRIELHGFLKPKRKSIDLSSMLEEKGFCCYRDTNHPKCLVAIRQV